MALEQLGAQPVGVAGQVVVHAALGRVAEDDVQEVDEVEGHGFVEDVGDEVHVGRLEAEEEGDAGGGGGSWPPGSAVGGGGGGGGGGVGVLLPGVVVAEGGDAPLEEGADGAEAGARGDDDEGLEVVFAQGGAGRGVDDAVAEGGGDARVFDKRLAEAAAGEDFDHDVDLLARGTARWVEA